jgi:extracellular elastinolytic metalloproteinase
VGNLSDAPQGLDDFDARAGSVAPSATQKNIANNLGAHVRWNRFGTPASLIKYGGYLATGLSGSPIQAARSWLRSKAALFRLTATQVDNLEVISDSSLSDGVGHAVMFRQRFGGLSATQDGLITVGIKGGKIAYVSSSAAGNQGTPAAATLTVKEAWLAAAHSVGRSGVALADIGQTRQENGWTIFPVDGFTTPVVEASKPVRRVDQRARLVALPTYTQGARAAYEVNVLDDRAGRPVIGYIVFVDARTGAVLFRHNAVDQAGSGMTLAAPRGDFFTGDYPSTAPECGPLHDLVVDAENRTLGVTAYPANGVNDIRLIVRDPGNNERGTSDHTGTGIPEVVVVDLANTGADAGTWTAQVCESANPVADSIPPTNYVGAYSAVDQSQPEAELFAFPPQWNFFTANPKLPDGPLGPGPGFNYPETDNRTNACWTLPPGEGEPSPCEYDLTPNVGDTNLASRAPWDHNVQANASNFMTFGNNAHTAEGWSTDLVPGPLSQRPIDLDRTYGFLEAADTGSHTGALEGWTNSWNRLKCSQTSLTPAENNADVLAATTTLHAGHNRFHDFSYHLGFTERNFNLQVNNFGTTSPPGPFPIGFEDDPEIGDVQNGALLPAALGLTRDNANQITLQDGVPGITNQYLFQPIAGGFYAPCADGDLDASIYGHEYTHAISNRMVAGPDSGLSGAQAGAMGESWSDQVAVEYLNAYNFVPTSAGENPFAVGIYATGNKERAIRNFGMNNSPLNYSDIGYDIVCEANLVGPPVEPECEDNEGQVHADGEIWSATGYDIRQALVQKYNGSFPAGNASLQKRCADGNLPADKCPGNRRWMQIVFDAFLLQQSGTSMLTARDAYLAADQLRFNGANQTQLWRAFAKRGMGSCSLNPSAPCHATRSAQTQGTDDDNPQPSFESPLEGEKTVTFVARSTATGAAINAKIYVGRYEARVTPIADTNPNSILSSTARFVPGTYSIVTQADGFGLRRFRLEASGTGTVNLAFYMPPNWASETNGATASGDGANFDALIDDTEGTTWDATTSGTNVNVSRPQVTVNLAGTTAQMVRSVRVSAMLTPGEASRFTALRQFRIDACNASAPVNDNCSISANFDTILTSPVNAFNAVAPRPVSPNLLIKSFDVNDSAATHLRLVVLNNQCTGGPDFQGEQDNDPLNDTDCDTASARGEEVHVAELEALGTGVDGADPPPPSGPKDPVVTLTKSGPLTTAAGSRLTYSLSYENLGPSTASSAKLVDTLPDGVTFVSATGGGTFNSTSRKVTWNLGNVAAGASGTRTLVVGVPTGTASGTLLLNQVEFVAPLTISTPGAFLTMVQ